MHMIFAQKNIVFCLLETIQTHSSEHFIFVMIKVSLYFLILLSQMLRFRRKKSPAYRYLKIGFSRKCLRKRAKTRRLFRKTIGSNHCFTPIENISL